MTSPPFAWSIEARNLRSQVGKLLASMDWVSSRITKKESVSWQDPITLQTRSLFRYLNLSPTCLMCGKAAHIAYHTQRTVATLTGRHRFHLVVRRCANPSCPHYHQPYQPEVEGAWALPHGEYGLDVIALIGFLRYQRHQCLAEIHQSLKARGLSIGERTVLNLIARYEELVTLHMTDRERLQPLVQKQGITHSGSGWVEARCRS